ncbi:MAG: DUF2442 domain-containing protein [Rudaea sp.]|uniref:DUF2442 domain-containing protein n=1 Tax=Rudaea sp. TaxID=2136325 RepID=UPI0039E3C9FE
MSRKNPPPRIESVRAQKGHALALRWSSGEEVAVDLAAEVRRLASLAPLRDAREFRRVKPGEHGHSVEWPSGVDIGADSLWRDTLIALGHADAVAFSDWRLSRGFTLDQAAEALGLSRRMVAYYESGEAAVPKTVVLACRGYDAQQRLAAA